MGKGTTINLEALEILRKSRFENNIVYLPPEQLERTLYEKVNKCLVGIGGKWNRKAKGHVFNEDAADLFDQVLITGQAIDIKKQFQFFETPKIIVEKLVELAEIKSKHTVLEPSAGHGAIAEKLDNVCVCEINPNAQKILKSKNYKLVGEVFLSYCLLGILKVLIAYTGWPI